MFVNIHSTDVMTICTRFDICSSGKVKSGDGYPNRVASFGIELIYLYENLNTQLVLNCMDFRDL